VTRISDTRYRILDTGWESKRRTLNIEQPALSGVEWAEHRIKIQTVASATSSNGEEGNEENEEWEGENAEHRTPNTELKFKQKETKRTKNRLSQIREPLFPLLSSVQPWIARMTRHGRQAADGGDRNARFGLNL